MSAFNLSKHTVVRVFLPLRMTTDSYRPSNNKSDTISKQWVVSRGRHRVSLPLLYDNSDSSSLKQSWGNFSQRGTIPHHNMTKLLRILA